MSDWTLEALKEYFTALLAVRDREVEVARDEVNRRLKNMNDLREQISEERGHYVSREVYDERHDELVRRVTAAEGALANLQGAQRIKTATIGWMLTAGGLVLTCVIVFVNLLTSGRL